MRMRKNQMAPSEQVLWGITALLACATVYFGAMTHAMELGFVMHDIHCPDHRATS